jgi:DNA-binding response OmpR family regulator
MDEAKKHTILVIEDERPLQEAITKKLEISGFDVISSRTAEQAIGYLGDMPIAAIWLDHYLIGKENGLDFVAEIKNHPEWKSIPVFVVSNTASPDKVHTYMQLGIDKFYTKANFRLDEIIGDIRSHVA